MQTPAANLDERLDPYEALQVSPRASQEVIQAAYRALARGLHPDVNPSPEAARQMKLLNSAYATIGEPRRRACYDFERARSRRSSERAVAAAATADLGRVVTPIHRSELKQVPIASRPAIIVTLHTGRLMVLAGAIAAIVATITVLLWALITSSEIL